MNPQPTAIPELRIQDYPELTIHDQPMPFQRAGAPLPFLQPQDSFGRGTMEIIAQFPMSCIRISPFPEPPVLPAHAALNILPQMVPGTTPIP